MNHPRLFAFLTFIFHFYIIPLELEAFVLDIHNPDRMIPVFTRLGKISLRIKNKVRVPPVPLILFLIIFLVRLEKLITDYGMMTFYDGLEV